MPDPCGVCGSRAYRRERCGECPSNRLDEAMQGAAGMLLARALAKRSMLQMKVSGTADDVDAEEFLAMQVLEGEIERYQKELRDRETRAARVRVR